MNKFIILIILSAEIICGQSFHSPAMRKLFADHLFCAQDYIRAIEEYEKYYRITSEDTVLFKIALSYLKLENYDNAASRLIKFTPESEFYYKSRLEYLKSRILARDYLTIKEFADNSSIKNELKLLNMSFLLYDYVMPEEKIFLLPFDGSELNTVTGLYRHKINPPEKSPVIAGLLSAIVPGAGKIYTNQISDGLTAFVLNGLFAFLSYNNFKHDHQFRGWLFAAAGSLFYAGNVYGSAVSAVIYNSRVEQEFYKNAYDFLESKNYFIGEYEFCR